MPRVTPLPSTVLPPESAEVYERFAESYGPCVVVKSLCLLSVGRYSPKLGTAPFYSPAFSH